MSEQFLDWLLVVLTVGAAVGFGGGYCCFKSLFELQREKHTAAVKELEAEIKRLRTQVAGLVGKSPEELKLAA